MRHRMPKNKLKLLEAISVTLRENPVLGQKNLGKVTDFLSGKKLILSIMLGKNLNFEHNAQSTQY